MFGLGNPDDAADATAGLAGGVEKAALVPAHRRCKLRKKRDDGLSAPRYEVTADVQDEVKNCGPVQSQHASADFLTFRQNRASSASVGVATAIG